MTTGSVNDLACPTFKLLAIAEDERTKQFSCVLEFVTIQGDTRRASMKRADFDHRKLLIETLKNFGAHFSPDDDINDAAISALIASSASAEKWKYASSTGWRSSDLQYVTSYETVGAGDPAVRVLAPCTGSDDSESKLSKRGTLKRWRKRVAKPARHSSRMVFSICSAFAAVVLKFSGQNSFGVQISGKAKTGKSTAVLAAASASGFAREKDLPNFRATSAALGELPAEFNDSLFPLNEFELVKGGSRAKHERLHDLAYGIAEGSGTAYSKFLRRKRSCNGEQSLSRIVKIVPRKLRSRPGPLAWVANQSA